MMKKPAWLIEFDAMPESIRQLACFAIVAAKFEYTGFTSTRSTYVWHDGREFTIIDTWITFMTPKRVDDVEWERPSTSSYDRIVNDLCSVNPALQDGTSGVVAIPTAGGPVDATISIDMTQLIVTVSVDQKLTPDAAAKSLDVIIASSNAGGNDYPI